MYSFTSKKSEEGSVKVMYGYWQNSKPSVLHQDYCLLDTVGNPVIFRGAFPASASF